jgi:multicomponent K+:H+ antiporter subunit A
MGIAGLIIFALLKSFAPGPVKLALPAAQDQFPLLLALLARLLLPLAAVVSLYLFFRGHNLPGGGFIGGLTLAIALILLYAANGITWTDRRSGGDYGPWIGWGLLIAGFTGIGSWFFGSPFLTTTYDYPWLPGVGGVPIASAMFFDLGVYLTVVGATLLALLSISRLHSTGTVPR